MVRERRATELLSLLRQDTESDSGLREWYFGFCACPPENIPPWQRFFLRKDPACYHHCYAFSQVGDYVLFVEPERDRIEFVVKYPTENHPMISAEVMAQELAEHGHIIARHRYVPCVNGIKSMWNWIPSCVTVVKCATGYPSFARTPKQLVQSLVRDGAHIFLKGEPEKWDLEPNPKGLPPNS